MAEIEVSAVMPCLNEEKGIRICIDKINRVFAEHRLAGEIIVADNGSTDRSREIAREAGAQVVEEPAPGYGAAYLRGLSVARGKFIVIADSDNTYDFGDIPRFLEALRAGSDFVMGSRFKGTIHKGAMPWAHRYIGNPVLSWMTRMFFHTRLSDIHCGMRAFTLQAYRKMKLHTLGMEFATEMVVAAITNQLSIAEIPIHYYPRQGESKLKSFSDAWRHIRFMLVYCPVWLYLVPGLTGFVTGMALLLILLPGPVLFLGHYWDVHLVVLSSLISIVSYQLVHMGIYAHTLAVGQGLLRQDRITALLQRHFNLEKWLLFGFVLFAAGIGINLWIFWEWFTHNFGPLYRIRESVLAMTLMVIGLQTVFSSFFISLLALKRK